MGASTRFTIHESHGVLVAGADRGGSHRVALNATIKVPTALRPVPGLRGGDQILLVADPPFSRLNTALKVPKPRRHPPTRFALQSERVAELNFAAATTGDDPELDSLLLRLHQETACRRGGAQALRPQDLEPVNSMILLREKNGTHHWKPVSPPSCTTCRPTPPPATNSCAPSTTPPSPDAATTGSGHD